MMEKVVKFRTKDRWGNQMTGNRTVVVLPETINEDGTAYRGNRVIDAFRNWSANYPKFVTEPASKIAQNVMLTLLLLIVLIMGAIGAFNTAQLAFNAAQLGSTVYHEHTTDQPG
jgi:hypothetical protein